MDLPSTYGSSLGLYTLLYGSGLDTLLWVVDLFIVSYWVAVQHTRLDMSFRYSFWKHNEMGSQSLTVFFSGPSVEYHRGQTTIQHSIF
jgi:hypothetical protein